MHELGLCDAIVDAVLRRARGRQVTELRVRIGGHVVDEDVVRQGVQLAAAGSVAAAARVELVLAPLRAHCPRCDAESPVTDHATLVACPQCGGLDVELSGEDTVVLESITLAQGERTLEEADAAWTPSSC